MHHGVPGRGGTEDAGPPASTTALYLSYQSSPYIEDGHTTADLILGEGGRCPTCGAYLDTGGPVINNYNSGNPVNTTGSSGGWVPVLQNGDTPYPRTQHAAGRSIASTHRCLVWPRVGPRTQC